VNEYIEANRRNWDDRVPIHLASDFYDVASFKAGRSTLMPIEREELGDVSGKTLLHLQCHFGLDTLSWARGGAIVTGVDFSGPAIEAARSLAQELQIEARFIETDVYKLPEALSGSFDIVFASYGVLCWLTDLPAWFKIAADFLSPGGLFYVIDAHPITDMLDDEEIKLAFPYLGAEPLRFESPTTYTDQQADLQHEVSYNFPHGIGEIVSAAIEAGLQLEFLHEFTQGFFPRLPEMRKRDDGYYELPDGNPLQLPFMFSLRARKPA
jgi:SAM-dependent methyltransferase